MKEKIKLFTLTIIFLSTLSVLIYTIIQSTISIQFLNRHINPSLEIEQNPYSKILTLIIIGTYDKLILRKYDETIETIRNLIKIYIPERYKYILNRFIQLTNNITETLKEIEQTLIEIEESTSIGRINYAKKLIDNTIIKLIYVNTTLNELLRAQEELTRIFNIPRIELLNRLDKLRLLIDELYNKILELSSRIEKQIYLKETFLNINVEPKIIWTGGNITVVGRLYSIDGPLNNKMIKVLMNKKELINVETSIEGEFNTTIKIPYIYIDEVFIQAIYMPKGEDKQLYKPIESNTIKVNILYIKPELSIQTIREVYPGKTFNVRGFIEAGVPLPYTNIYVSWIEERKTLNIINESFEANLYTPINVNEGVYVLKIEVPSWEIFAPTIKTISIQVKRLPLNFEIQIPKIMLTGLTSQITGRIIYGEEKFNATIKLKYAEQTYETNIDSNGEFKITLTTPITILTSHQEYELTIIPELPWYKSVKLNGSILVINIFTILITYGFTLITIIIMIKKIMKIKLKKEIVKGEKEEIIMAKEEVEIIGERLLIDSKFKWLLDSFWKIVLFIKRVIGIEFKASMTYREYLKIVKERIGIFKEAFEKLTLIIEKIVYAPKISEEEVDEAKKIVEEFEYRNVGENS